MRLGIDASNIRSGGGLTHLSELLGAADPAAHGFDQVVLWSSKATSERIAERSWLAKHHHPMLEQGSISSAVWQRTKLESLARALKCEILFCPGGSIPASFHPVVTMSRNLLPFEWRELRRFGFSWLAVKAILLRFKQTRSYREADGVIFLTEYAREAVLAVAGHLRGRTTIIPHGVSKRFVHEPRAQRPFCDYTRKSPYNILYVSAIDPYKHQPKVVEGISLLRNKGLPVRLELIGPPGPHLAALRKSILKFDPSGDFISYQGSASYSEIHKAYKAADMKVFASSCENMPNILLEAMASGLPIACSNMGPMPEILRDGGTYFDPEVPHEIASAVEQLFRSRDLRYRVAENAFRRASSYSWERAADETFSFLKACAEGQPV